MIYKFIGGIFRNSSINSHCNMSMTLFKTYYRARISSKKISCYESTNYKMGRSLYTMTFYYVRRRDVD